MRNRRRKVWSMMTLKETKTQTITKTKTRQNSVKQYKMNMEHRHGETKSNKKIDAETIKHQLTIINFLLVLCISSTSNILTTIPNKQSEHSPVYTSNTHWVKFHANKYLILSSSVQSIYKTTSSIIH